MAQVQSTATHLVVTLTGARRAFGRWRPLSFPWTQVTGVRVDPEAARRFPGARWGVASNIPGVINLGSFRRNGSRDFWDVADPTRAVVVELRDAKYDRLLLEVDDPQATAAAIRTRLARER